MILSLLASLVSASRGGDRWIDRSHCPLSASMTSEVLSRESTLVHLDKLVARSLAERKRGWESQARGEGEEESARWVRGSVCAGLTAGVSGDEGKDESSEEDEDPTTDDERLHTQRHRRTQAAKRKQPWLPPTTQTWESPLGISSAKTTVSKDYALGAESLPMVLTAVFLAPRLKTSVS